MGKFNLFLSLSISPCHAVFKTIYIGSYIFLHIQELNRYVIHFYMMGAFFFCSCMFPQVSSGILNDFNGFLQLLSLPVSLKNIMGHLKLQLLHCCCVIFDVWLNLSESS